MRQRAQIEHGLSFREVIELDRAECDTAGAQGRQYLVQIRTLANEHRDRFSSACERTMDSRNDRGRFPDGIGAEIEGDRGIGVRLSGRRRRFERDRSARRVFVRRKHVGKRSVHPIDQALLGAKVSRQGQRLERDTTDAPVSLSGKKQADIGFAEAVNRLHRVADDKQGTAIAGRPTLGKPLDQLVLCERRILELVQEQVLDPHVEREQQLGGPLLRGQGAQRDQRRFRVIDGIFPGEHELQPGHRVPQHIEQRSDERPRSFVVTRWRERPHRMERCNQTGNLF